jgi:hypothetical protein
MKYPTSRIWETGHIKMKKHILTSLTLMFVFIAFASSAYCQNYTIKQLTDNDFIDGSPHINNLGQVVWSGFEGHDYEIFLYDGSKIIQLTYNERNDRKPNINDNGQIVWEADIGDIEIFLANPN